VRAGPPEALGQFIASEKARWAKVVKDNGIKAD
jgi:tripartite-type tricarboxylate transporter receptor subunit TctC